MTRIQRWHAAVAELVDLQADYTAWLDALPESLRDTATAEALQAIVDLDLEGLAAIELPRGYGRADAATDARLTQCAGVRGRPQGLRCAHRQAGYGP